MGGAGGIDTERQGDRDTSALGWGGESGEAADGRILCMYVCMHACMCVKCTNVRCAEAWGGRGPERTEEFLAGARRLAGVREDGRERARRGGEESKREREYEREGV